MSEPPTRAPAGLDAKRHLARANRRVVIGVGRRE
jgi:hypothetical protein